MTGGRRDRAHRAGDNGGPSTYLVESGLFQPLVLRVQAAQGQLGEGSGFGQRWERLTQLGEEGRKGPGQGPGPVPGWRVDRGSR